MPLLVLGTVGTPRAAVVNLPADTLINWLNYGPRFDFLLIDVRDSATEVAPDSVIGNDSCQPYNLSLNGNVLLPAVSVVPKSAHTVIYCRSGSRSTRAADSLAGLGFQNVYNVTNGFINWHGPKMPASRVKARSQLPEPSMRARPSLLTSRALTTGACRAAAGSVLTVAGWVPTVGADRRVLLSGRSAAAPLHILPLKH